MYRFRKVAQADKDRVLEISSKIWEGHDFINTFLMNGLRTQTGSLHWERKMELL